MSNEIKYVVEKDSGAICRIVTYCNVDYNYIIKCVYGGGGKWNDMTYDGVKAGDIRELTEEEIKQLYTEYLCNLEKSDA